MKNFIIGYARVSTADQNLERQIDALQSFGADIIYTEKMSGTKKNRPELEKMLERITAGDTVVVESFSRLGRSTKDLIELIDSFREKGVDFISLKEEIDTSTSTGKLIFTIMSALAQFERDLLVERTNEGLQAARRRGRVGGRPRVPRAKIDKAIALYRTNQYTIREITEFTDVRKATLYRYLKLIESDK